mmetsp:Transcript_16440/g.29186  ORF Transcript_16440/g.29186 Transcript_16440/m.29186 type:complete len:387 (+) Transcript_16440:82-1242(+)
MMAWFRLLLTLFALQCALSLSQRRPVIVDTDLGQDMDDTWALAYLLASPEVEVKLIVTSSRCTWGKARLLATFLKELGRPDVAIGVGVATSPPEPEAWAARYCNGTGHEVGCSEGFFVGPAAAYSDATIDLRSVHADGVRAMAEVLLASASPVALVAIGPATNLEALQRRFPQAASRADVFAMIGSFYRGYGRPAGSIVAEYNCRMDVHAASAVFQNADHWRSLVLSPVDSCGGILLEGANYKAFYDAAKAPRGSSRGAKAVLRMYEVWHQQGCAQGFFCSCFDSAECLPSKASTVLYDLQPAYMVVAEAAAGSSAGWRRDIATKKLQVEVNSSGFTLAVDSAGGLSEVALQWHPGGIERFYAELLKRLVPVQVSSELQRDPALIV